MSMYKGISWLLISTSLICLCNCQDSFADHRLELLEKDLLDTKGDMKRMEERIRIIIDAAKTSLRVELKETIRAQVRETMGEIVQGETFHNIVKKVVVSGLNQMRRGYQQMKRQYHHMSKLFRDYQDEMAGFHDFVLKKVNLWNGQNTIDACAREKHRLELELQKSNISVAERKHDNERLLELNESCQFQISQLKTAFSVSVSPGESHHVNSTSATPALKTLVTTSTTTPTRSGSTTVRKKFVTTSVTTPRSQTTPMPAEVRSRILIAPLWTSRRHQHQFRQLNIHNNSLSVYPYHNLANVNCIAYLAKTREVLIGLDSPHMILASTLDTNQVRVLHEGVLTCGMAVDEGQEVVFMGTGSPKYSISRMSTQGDDFTTVIETAKDTYPPSQITLDAKRKKIYWGNYDKLYAVTYDGQGLATLATGSFMFALSLDQTAGVLHYNNGRELMRMTVSNNVSTGVITLSAIPMNMMLYRGIIYYGGVGAAVLYTVNVTSNTGAYSLESKPTRGIDTPYLCLIP